MNIDNPKLIKQLESLVDNRQDWLFRFAYIRIGQREDAEDIAVSYTHLAQCYPCAEPLGAVDACL